MTARSLALVVLPAEAALGLAWWIVLLARPELGRVFLPSDVPPDLIRTFVVADFVAYVAAPAAAAAGIARDRPWAAPVLWLHAGAALYAALWGWGTVAATGEGLLGAALMTPSAAVLPWLAARLAR